MAVQTAARPRPSARASPDGHSHGAHRTACPWSSLPTGCAHSCWPAPLPPFASRVFRTRRAPGAEIGSVRLCAVDTTDSALWMNSVRKFMSPGRVMPPRCMGGKRQDLTPKSPFASRVFRARRAPGAEIGSVRLCAVHTTDSALWMDSVRKYMSPGRVTPPRCKGGKRQEARPDPEVGPRSRDPEVRTRRRPDPEVAGCAIRFRPPRASPSRCP